MSGERLRRLPAAGATVAVALLCVALAPASAQADTCLGANEEVTRAELAPAAERTLLCLVNMHRQSHNLAPLALERTLAKAAGGHSHDMVIQDFFDHINPNTGSDPQVRAENAGYSGGVGENIAYTDAVATPQYIFDLWKNSDGHNMNMLDSRYAVAGMGLEVGWPDTLPGVPTTGFTGTQVFGLEPTAATDTALDLVVSDQCAAAHAEMRPVKEDYDAAKAAQTRAAERVAKKREKLKAAETPIAIERARYALKQAKQKLKGAKAESAEAAGALEAAEARVDAACA